MFVFPTRLDPKRTGIRMDNRGAQRFLKEPLHHPAGFRVFKHVAYQRYGSWVGVGHRTQLAKARGSQSHVALDEGRAGFGGPCPVLNPLMSQGRDGLGQRVELIGRQLDDQQFHARRDTL